jgi:hypothetical protein
MDEAPDQRGNRTPEIAQIPESPLRNVRSSIVELAADCVQMSGKTKLNRCNAQIPATGSISELAI